MSTLDIGIYETGSSGDISVSNNDIALGDQLLQYVYLALFGGQVEADTLGNEPAGEIRLDWWGNSLLFALDQARQFNSQTERALNNNALGSSGRVAIQQAVLADLKFFKSFADITVNVVILSNNKVNIQVGINQLSQKNITISLLWDSAQKAVIVQEIIS
jgi:phage gp46-like protein